MHPISKILCRAYDVLLKNGQINFPLAEEHQNALDSVVKTINSSFFGIERFPTDADKAVGYLCHLIKRHALADGNKRLALLWFETWCSACEISPKEPEFGYDALVVSIESTDADDLDETMRSVKELLFGDQT